MDELLGGGDKWKNVQKTEGQWARECEGAQVTSACVKRPTSRGFEGPLGSAEEPSSSEVVGRLIESMNQGGRLNLPGY